MRIIKGLFVFLFGTILGVVGGFVAGVIGVLGFLSKFGCRKYRVKDMLLESLDELLNGKRYYYSSSPIYRPSYTPRSGDREYTFATKADAEKFLEDVVEEIEKYAQLTVAEANQIARRHMRNYSQFNKFNDIKYTDAFFGWDDEFIGSFKYSTPVRTSTGDYCVTMPIEVELCR